MTKYTLTQLELPLDGVVKITISTGHITTVDIEDADLASVRWYGSNKNGRIYVWRKVGETVNKQRPTIHLHRVIMERIIGRPLLTTELIDHKDNDPLNNLRDNLRIADKSKNATNAKKRIDNTSGYKGVWYHKQVNKWCAEIKVNKRKKYLGLFDTAEIAYEAYCKAAKEVYGEYARLE